MFLILLVVLVVSVSCVGCVVPMVIARVLLGLLLGIAYLKGHMLETICKVCLPYKTPYDIVHM